MRNSSRRKKRGVLTEGLKSFERLHKIGQGVELHIQRAAAQIVVSQGVGAPKIMVQAIVMLNELSPIGIVLFAQASFINRQAVTLNIPELQNFFVKGKVTACQEIPMSPGIIRKQPYKFRVQIRFEFSNEAEREAVRAYCEFLASQYLRHQAA